MRRLFECGVEELLESICVLFESKDRLIDRIPNLDDEKRGRMKAFFRRNPSLEKRFDWNRPDSITWDSFSELEDEYPESIDPDTVPEFSDKRDEGDGIVSYEVEDSYRGQEAVRRIVDTHWGKDANPWCIVQTDGWGLTDSSVRYWDDYSVLPKRIAFKNGKLVAFMATDVDRSDNTDVDEDALAEKYPTYWREYDRQDFSGEMFPPHFVDWLEDAHPDALLGVGEEWWDRKDQSHPNLDFAR